MESEASRREDGGTVADLRPMMMGIEWSFCAFVILAAAGRLYSRFKFSTLGLDDWCIPPATVGLIATAILHQRLANRQEVGLHLWDSHPPPGTQLDHALFLLAQSIYHWSTGFLRVSVCLLVRRINTPAVRWQGVVNAALVFNSLFPIACVCTLLTACVPVSRSVLGPGYESTPQGKRCIEVRSVMSALPIAADFGTWLVPGIIVVQLRSSWREKFLVMALLGLGIIACFACAIRIPVTHHAIRSDDRTWNMTGVFILTATEIAVGILAASVPSLRPLFRHWRKQISTQVSDTAKSSKNTADSESILLKSNPNSSTARLNADHESISHRPSSRAPSARE